MMKIVSAYKSRDGELHSDPIRCAASNLRELLPETFSDGNRKILDWSECLKIIQYRLTIEKIYEELDDLEVGIKYEAERF